MALADEAGLDDTLRAVLTAERERIAAWLRQEPGAWGALASAAVLAERRRRGRSLSDAERRLVWQRLWERLLVIRQAGEQTE